MFNRVINFAIKSAYRWHSYNIWLISSTILHQYLCCTRYKFFHLLVCLRIFLSQFLNRTL